jgi:hypothetical protein
MKDLKFTAELIERVKNNWVMKGKDLSNLNGGQITELFCESAKCENGEPCEIGLRMDIVTELMNQFKG